MKPKERGELIRIINTVFESGINKKRLLEAMEQFIDKNYMYSEYIARHTPLQGLLKSMERSGNYTEWKRKFIREIKNELNR